MIASVILFSLLGMLLFVKFSSNQKMKNLPNYNNIKNSEKLKKLVLFVIRQKEKITACDLGKLFQIPENEFHHLTNILCQLETAGEIHFQDNKCRYISLMETKQHDIF